MSQEPSGVTDRYERAYHHILEETKEVLPETRLILCEPLILNTGAPAQNWEAWYAKLRHYQMIVRLLAEQYDAVFVPLQETLDQACTLLTGCGIGYIQQRRSKKEGIVKAVRPIILGMLLMDVVIL